MKENFEASLAHVLKSEGGFVNHPKDPGGMTNLGCTKAVWEEFVGHPVTETDMRALTPADVAPLYKRKYWDKVAGDDLPDGLDYVVFDAAINSGPSRAAKWLQEMVHVEVDGDIGPGTLKAVAEQPVKDLIARYTNLRLQFLKRLTTWNTFGKGWGNRIRDVNDTAFEMTA
jgi:lysozyme family protein